MSDNCIMCGKAPETHSFPSGMCMTPDGGTYYTAMKFSGWRTPEEAMNDQKYVVPEGGLKAAIKGWDNFGGIGVDARIKEILEAFIRWQAENPVGPTDTQFGELVKECSRADPAFWEKTTEWHRAIILCGVWQSRMYLAPQFDPSLGGILCGRTFTQNEANAIKEYIQMSVKPYTRA